MQGHQRYYTRVAGKVYQTTCRCITLEVTHSRGQYVPGQRWQIPEPELDRAYSEIRNEDDGFRKRCNALKPSSKDVETLINRATHGVIDLKLSEDDDDFMPVITR